MPYTPVECCVVDQKTGAIINVIIADPMIDVAPEGASIVARPEEKLLSGDVSAGEGAA